MSHKHNSNCGHDQATHDRIHEKMGKFIEEIADDLFSEQDLANLFTVIKGGLRAEKIPTSLPYIRAFNEGFQFGIYATQQEGTDSMLLVSGMKRISKLKEDEIKALATKATTLKEEEPEDNNG